MKDKKKTSAIVRADDETFDGIVKDSELPVLVDFSAHWCEPCRMLAKFLPRAAKALDGEVRFVTVDVDKCEATSTRFRIDAVPKLILFVGGARRATFTGYIAPDDLETWIRSKLRSKPRARVSREG